MDDFWHQLKKPVMVQAPMANVTDAAWRQLFAKYGKPDVTYTEFVSADGLLRADEEGKRKLLRDMVFTEAERPIVVQFFTSDPEAMEYAARLAAQMGFDGVDINMGCPDRAVEKQGAGASLIKNPARAAELIAAARRGAPGLPISVKTRIGYNKNTLEEWLPVLLAAEPSVVIIHARTRKEMSKVPAQWEHIARAVEIRNATGSNTLIMGNGDVMSLADARAKATATGADGVMIGRALFGSPWFFADGDVPPLETRLRIMVEHTKLFERLLDDIKSFSIMKKHFKAYAEGFPGARELRIKLMETENADEVERITQDFLDASNPTH